jgi:hypothetical protein
MLELTVQTSPLNHRPCQPQPGLAPLHAIAMHVAVNQATSDSEPAEPSVPARVSARATSRLRRIEKYPNGIERPPAIPKATCFYAPSPDPGLQIRIPRAAAP